MPAERRDARHADGKRRTHRINDRGGETLTLPYFADACGIDTECFGLRGDHGNGRDIRLIDEERTRYGVMELRHHGIPFAFAHQFADLQRKTRIDVAARWVDRNSDALGKTDESRADRRPLLVGKRFGRAFGRRIRM